MNDADFIQALAADPADDTTRLVFADWLEEHGDLRAPWVRDLAIWRWMGARAENPVPLLLAAIPEADWCQSGEIASVLQRIGPPAVPALVEALQSDHVLAEWASIALRGFAPEDLAPVLPHIRELAATGNLPAVKFLAGVASEVRAVAPTLIERLGHTSETIRLLATTGPEAASLLLAEVAHVDSYTLGYLVSCLRQFGESVAPLLHEALTEADPRRWLVAALALAPLDPHAAAPRLVEALEIASLEADIVPCCVLDCIRGLGVEAAAPVVARLRRMLCAAGERRFELLRTLEAIDDPVALVAQLLGQLHSERWQERAEAIDSLAYIEWPPVIPVEVVDAVVRMLADGDERVRARAVSAIASLAPRGHEEAIAAVRERYRDHLDPEAIRALGTLGAPGFPAELFPLCQHEDEAIRLAALRTLILADEPNADVAAVLCQALDTESGGDAVDVFQESPAALALAAGAIVARLRGDRPTRYHIQLVRGLGLSADEEVELLCRHLGFVGEIGAEVLHELSYNFDGRPPADAMPALLRLLDENGDHCQTAAALLARMGAPAVPELIRRLKDEKRREVAAWGLGLMGPKAAEACAALIVVMHAGDNPGSVSAATALGNIGPAATCAIGDLRRVARGTSARLRAAAAEALGKIGAREALPDLRAMLSDPSESVRIYAAGAIATLTREPARGGGEDAEIPF